MGLNLITGPANAGKVLLLRRYLEALPREPYLIVPNRSDVEERERELLAIQPALLGGSIGTFDDLFRQIARAGGETPRVASEAQRSLIVRRALASQSLNGLGRSARFGGFADALLATVGELESARPERLGGRARGTVRGISRRARPRTPLGRGFTATPWSSASGQRARRLERRAGLRVRLRGFDRRGVGAAAGARRPQRGDRVDALRAEPPCVRVA